EFMASGMATVSNRNPHTAWLLRHEENALLADPLPALVAEQVARLVEDPGLRGRLGAARRARGAGRGPRLVEAPGLRERLAAAGRAEVAGRSWDDELERVWGAMTK